ncbi:MAG: hypothetical protein H6691_06910 [Gemmatimonadales bacterium]|nr:hypothetical protein [Gemmatimonadales bacterium]
MRQVPSIQYAQVSVRATEADQSSSLLPRSGFRVADGGVEVALRLEFRTQRGRDPRERLAMLEVDQAAMVEQCLLGTRIVREGDRIDRQRLVEVGRAAEAWRTNVVEGVVDAGEEFDPPWRREPVPLEDIDPAPQVLHQPLTGVPGHRGVALAPEPAQPRFDVGRGNRVEGRQRVGGQDVAKILAERLSPGLGEPCDALPVGITAHARSAEGGERAGPLEPEDRRIEAGVASAVERREGAVVLTLGAEVPCPDDEGTGKGVGP